MTNVLMDEALALARVGGDRRLLAELLGLFLAEYPRLLNSIRQSMQAGNLRAAADTTHQLKGLLAQFAAEPARLGAAGLERALRQEEAVEAHELMLQTTELLKELDPVLRAVHQASLL